MGVATLRSTALSPVPVTTSAGAWTATLIAKGGRAIALTFQSGASASVEARDDQFWDGGWSPFPGTTGVLVIGNNTGATVTVAALEAALNATAAVHVQVPSAAPSATIDMDAMDGQELAATFVAPQPRTAGSYARMMLALRPPGRLWLAVGGQLADLFLGAADELVRVDGRADDLLDEADPTTATELLPEYERELGIAAAPTLQERRANVVARELLRPRNRPVDFQEALAPLLGQAAADVVVIERTRAFCIAVGDDREIFRFFIYRNPALPGTYFLASAQAIVANLATQRGGLKPSHTAGYVIESINFLCDDPFSQCDRDLLGA